MFYRRKYSLQVSALTIVLFISDCTTSQKEYHLIKSPISIYGTFYDLNYTYIAVRTDRNISTDKTLAIPSYLFQQFHKNTFQEISRALQQQTKNFM